MTSTSRVRLSQALRYLRSREECVLVECILSSVLHVPLGSYRCRCPRHHYKTKAPLCVGTKFKRRNTLNTLAEHNILFLPLNCPVASVIYYKYSTYRNTTVCPRLEGPNLICRESPAAAAVTAETTSIHSAACIGPCNSPRIPPASYPHSPGPSHHSLLLTIRSSPLPLLTVIHGQPLRARLETALDSSAAMASCSRTTSKPMSMEHSTAVRASNECLMPLACLMSDQA